MPGVPAATAVPAYAGIPTATTGTAEFRVVDAARVEDWSAHASCAGPLVIHAPVEEAAAIAKALVAAGRADTTPIAVTVNGTLSPLCRVPR